jgi:hypothetical protein
MLFSATFLVNLAALATGLWLGLYVVTRSPGRGTSWLTALTLWSLSGHFLNVLLALAPLLPAAGAPSWLDPLQRFWGGRGPGGANLWLQGWLIWGSRKVIEWGYSSRTPPNSSWHILPS